MRTAQTLALALSLVLAPLAAHAQVMIIGIDSKVAFDKTGTPVFGPPGKDVVTIVDYGNREAPKIVASLPLMNSIFGSPTNLAITPDQKLPSWPTRWTGRRTARSGRQCPTISST
jgi:hypothetical protein